MVYINNLYDVTMTPSLSLPKPVLQLAQRQSFDQAAATNRIYQNNGRICQEKMCRSMTGCESELGCPQHPEWRKVLDFCGPIGTQGLSRDGSYWVLLPADSQQKLLAATKQATGMSVLPTPYNVIGMY